jgi:hypothetical protein
MVLKVESSYCTGFSPALSLTGTVWLDFNTVTKLNQEYSSSLSA